MRSSVCPLAVSRREKVMYTLYILLTIEWIFYLCSEEKTSSPTLLDGCLSVDRLGLDWSCPGGAGVKEADLGGLELFCWACHQHKFRLAFIIISMHLMCIINCLLYPRTLPRWGRLANHKGCDTKSSISSVLAAGQEENIGHYVDG